MRGLVALLTNPVVRQIARPLIVEIVDYVRGQRSRPRWLDVAVAEVPELKTPVAVAEARARRAKR